MNEFNEDVGDRQDNDDLSVRKIDLVTRLKALAVASVEIEYDGSGDEGFVETIAAKNAQGAVIRLDDKTWSDIDVYICDALPDGWEIDEGSFGTVVIDVSAEKWHFEHNDRFTDYTTDCWEE